MLQRLMITAALINQPQILVADKPLLQSTHVIVWN
ncbi:MAG: hypothetical protein ACLRRA_09700 [Acutalibacteraceae bacterium]